MTQAKISIGSWAYAIGPYSANPVPMDEVIVKLAQLGYDGIELGGFKPHAHPDLYPTKESRKEFVGLLEKYRLGVSAYVPDLWSFPFASGDPEAIRKHEAMFDQSLEFCVDCGFQKLRLDNVSGTPFPAGWDYGETWDRVTEVFRRYADKARDVGKEIVWEFEPGFIFNKPSEIKKFFHDVGKENFSILFDTSHAQMCAVVGAKQTEPKETLPGGVMEFITMLKGCIGHVHLIDSDNTLHDEETSTHAPFGTGYVDFTQVIPALMKNGYPSPWWCIDLCFWPNAWEITADSIVYLRGLFSRLDDPGGDE
ncbi:MAG TPA: sugar phosphate isomerase/epimerase family protein [Atribacteraceae bacterium]|nr:sugar phosphate isomerase/epimerase family protein [Atribacteraceae bacterium]